MYESIGEETGLFFGLIEEREKKQGLIDKIMRRKPEIERILNPRNISNMNPAVSVRYEGKNIMFKLIRGEFSDSIGYHININYMSGKKD